jgi:hypothetical protein
LLAGATIERTVAEASRGALADRPSSAERDLAPCFRPSRQARSGPREQVFMITGFGVHERTD